MARTAVEVQELQLHGRFSSRRIKDHSDVAARGDVLTKKQDQSMSLATA
jgi:hypothetical protein